MGTPLADLGLAAATGDSDVEALIREVQEHHPDADGQAIRGAYRFAEERHGGQERHSGDPYITHPLGVARIVAGLGLDVDTIQAALLHDVVEDTITTPEEVRSAFGARAENLVVWLTAPDARVAGDAVRDYYRRLLEQGPPDAHLLKIADRSDNLRSIQALVMRTGDEHRRWAGAYLNRTQWQVLPLAADAPSRARVALVTAMADLAPLVEPVGFTEP